MVRPTTEPTDDLVSLDEEDCTSSSSLILPSPRPLPSAQQRRRASVSFSPTAIRAAMKSVTGQGDAEGGWRSRRRSQHKQPAVALQPPSSLMPPPPPRLPASELSPVHAVRRRVSVSMGLGFRRAPAPHTPDQDSATDVLVARSSSATQDTPPSEQKTRYLPRRLMRRGSSSLSPRSLQEAMKRASESNNNKNNCPQDSETGLSPMAIFPGGSPAEPRRSQRRRFSASLSPSSLRAAVRWSARGLGDDINRGADAAGARRAGRVDAMDSRSVRHINSPKEAETGIQGKRSGRRSMSLALGGQANLLGLPLPISSPSNAPRGDRPSGGPGFRERLRQRAGGDGRGLVRSLSPPPARGSRRGTIWMGSELRPFEAAQMVSSEASARAAVGGLGVRDDRGRAHSLLAAVPAFKRSKVLKDLYER